MSLIPGDPGPGDPGIDLEAAVVSLESSATDGKMLLKLLVRELTSVLDDRMTVERAGGFLKKSDEVKRVTIRLGDDVLEAALDGPAITCTVGHGSGGIRIRTDKVDMADWLTRLLTVVSDESRRSEAARQALENIVIGKSV